MVQSSYHTWNNFISIEGAGGVRFLSKVYLLPIEGVVCLQFLLSSLGQDNGLNQRSKVHKLSGNTLKVQSQPTSRISLEKSQANENSQTCPEMFKCHLQLEHMVTRDLLVPVSLHMMLHVLCLTLELVKGRHEVHRQVDIVAHRLSCMVGVTGPSKRAMNNRELQHVERQ